MTKNSPIKTVQNTRKHLNFYFPEARREKFAKLVHYVPFEKIYLIKRTSDTHINCNKLNIFLYLMKKMRLLKNNVEK